MGEILTESPKRSPPTGTPQNLGVVNVPYGMFASPVAEPLKLVQNLISLTASPQSLGFLLNPHLFLESHVSTVAGEAFAQL